MPRFAIRAAVSSANIVSRVASICDRPALRHQPSVEILGTQVAHRDNAAVAVGVTRLAHHYPLPDVIGQGESRLLTASVGVSVRRFAQWLDSLNLDQKKTLEDGRKRLAVIERAP